MTRGRLIYGLLYSAKRHNRGLLKTDIRSHMEKIFRHIINMKGVNVGGKNYNNLRDADDTALLAGN